MNDLTPFCCLIWWSHFKNVLHHNRIIIHHYSSCLYIYHICLKSECYAFLNILHLSCSAPVLLKPNLSVFSGMKTNGSHNSQKYNWDSLNILQSNGPLFWMEPKTMENMSMNWLQFMVKVMAGPRATLKSSAVKNFMALQPFIILWMAKIKISSAWPSQNPNDPSRVRIHIEAT